MQSHITFNRPYLIGTEFDRMQDAVGGLVIAEGGTFTTRCVRWLVLISAVAYAACATVELTPEEIRSVGIADLRARAGQGDLTAQVTLGDIYVEGDGVPEDDAEGARWYRLAAEQGSAEAQLALGGMYFSGQGVAEDAAEGVRWWRLAAEQGHLPAQTGLGGRYFDGRGVAQDEAEAVRWYRMAAEQGDEEVLAWLLVTAEQGSIEAQVNLAEMYSVMIGRAANVAEAVRWYRLAAEQRDEEALLVVQQMAEQGNAEAQVALASMYATGRGLPEDGGEALRWYRLAAEQGLVEAQVALASMYATGRGLPEDGGEALRWYRLAAEQGSVEAQIALGGMHAEGRGVAQDETEALRWYLLAAEQDDNEPVTRLRRMAEQGSVEAQAALAAVYAVGRGITDDPFFMPIAAGQTAIEVGIIEFATIPNSDGQAARMMLLVDEPGTGRLFVNDMRGPLYSVSYNGTTVTQYLDLNADSWGVSVESSGFEQGFQSFAFHPQFNEPHTPGFGKLYTLTDTSDTRPPADFASGGNSNSHDTVLLEWIWPGG